MPAPIKTRQAPIRNDPVQTAVAEENFE